jgi:hypothetical protein
VADRKQFLGDMNVDSDLVKLLNEARETPVTEDELHEQRISFAFGNSPDSEFITKETVRKASKMIRLAS